MSTESDQDINQQQLVDEQAPLTKPKNSKKKQAPDVNETEAKPVKTRKPMPPKTPRQLEVFHEKCVKARKSSVEKKKDDIIESAKTIIKQEMKKVPPPMTHLTPQSESESEPEVIHVKKAKRKPKKKIVVVHSDSSTSSESSSSSEEEKPYKQFGKSHKNKKYAPVEQPRQKAPEKLSIKTPKNYFAD
jgi:hypothetical protein